MGVARNLVRLGAVPETLGPNRRRRLALDVNRPNRLRGQLDLG